MSVIAKIEVVVKENGTVLEEKVIDTRFKKPAKVFSDLIKEYRSMLTEIQILISFDWGGKE